MSDSELKYRVKPTAGRIAIQIDPPSTQRGSILLLRDPDHERPTSGTVIETCEDYEQDGEDYEPLFKKGDLVVFGKYTGTKLTIGRASVVIMREADILCRLIPSEDGLAQAEVAVTDRHGPSE